MIAVTNHVQFIILKHWIRECKLKFPNLINLTLKLVLSLHTLKLWNHLLLSEYLKKIGLILYHPEIILKKIYLANS